jgi:hypothetical protein
VTARWSGASLVVLAIVAAVGGFLAVRKPERKVERLTEDGHAHVARPVPTPPRPEELLSRFVDAGSTASVPTIRLSGVLEGPDFPQPYHRIEETAAWPDRWERRVIVSGDVAWVRLEKGRVSRSPQAHVPGLDLSVEEAWMRLRAVFSLRHLSEAAARGGAGVPYDLSGEPTWAHPVSDGGGPFGLLVGGVAGGLRGIESGTRLVLFSGHFRTGHWMYPASQSLVEEGRIKEIVRVVSTESAAGG